MWCQIFLYLGQQGRYVTLEIDNCTLANFGCQFNTTKHPVTSKKQKRVKNEQLLRRVSKYYSPGNHYSARY